MKKFWNNIKGWFGLKSVSMWIAIALMAYGMLWYFVWKPAAAAMIPDPGRNLMDAPFSDVFKAIEEDPSHSSIRFLTNKENGQIIVHCDCGARAIKSIVPAEGKGRLIDKALELKVRIDAEDDGLGGHVKEATATDYVSTGFSVLLVLLVGASIYMAMRRGGMAGGAGAMSKLKDFKPIKSETTFADIEGIDEQKKELQVVVTFLKERKTLEELGGKFPRGIMLIGPSGTGKTELARAIAGEADIPFFSCKSTELVEMYVGVGASRFREFWAEAAKYSPCVFFMDEVDAVASKRSGSGGGNNEREVTLNEMLISLDGIEGRYPILFVCATNRVDIIDPAFKSRMTRIIEVGLPSTSGRKAIFRVHSRKINIAGKEDETTFDAILQRAAELSEGMSGRDIMMVMTQRIFVNCVLRHGRLVTPLPPELIYEALEAQMLGDPLYSKLRKPDFRRVVCDHEGGHLITCEVLYRYTKELQARGELSPHAFWANPTKVATVIPRSTGSEGVVLNMGEDADTANNLTWHNIIGHLITAQAGNAAEFIKHRTCTIGNAGDNRMSMRLALMAVTKSAMSAFSPRSITLPPIFLGDTGEQPGLVAPPQFYGASEESQMQIDKAVGEFLWGGRFGADAILSQRLGLLQEISDLLMQEGTIHREQYVPLFDAWDKKQPMDHEQWLKYFRPNGEEVTEIEKRKRHFALGGNPTEENLSSPPAANA